MGLWDSLRSLLSGTAAPPTPPLEWRFVDDREWAERLDALEREGADPTLVQVYGDWLEERGDTRAELLRRFGKPGFDDFVHAHAATLFADWAPQRLRPRERQRPALGLEWRQGVLFGLSVRTESPWTDARELVTRPLCAHLRAVGIGARPESEEATAEALEHLARHVPRLRSLHVGDFVYPDECEMSWARAGDLSSTWKLMPTLTSFKAQGLVGDLGDIVAPNLTRFVRETSGLTKQELASITHARWPDLTHLELWFGAEQYGAECSIDDLRPLLAKAPPPHLTSLGLRNCEFADELMGVLLGSPWLRQVKRLDLSLGTLTDEGAAELLSSRVRVAHLEALDLSRNLLGEQHLAELASVCGAVSLEGQRREDMEEDLRYVAVGE